MLLTKNSENINTLLIFDFFETDYTLPKYKNIKNAEKLSDNVATSGIFFNQGNTNVTSNGFIYSNGQLIQESLINKIIRLITIGYVKTKQKIQTQHVEYIFKLVLSNEEELKIFDEKNKEYQKTIDNAKLTGQIALVEELEKNKEIKKFENQLIAHGMTRYISEKTLLKYVDHCEKGLKLDFIKNFTRIIPNDIIEKKIKCDEIGLFDNYVILYYDPNNNSSKLTKKEQEKLKDPIIFGVINGTRKLYYIGDWKDEQCTLTFDDILKVIEEKEVTLT